MTYENLLLDQEKGIVTITINRPKALNAINTPTMLELGHFFQEGYKSFEGLQSILITGSGEKAFIAGADIKEFEGLNAQEAMTLSARGHGVFNSIEHFHLPVLAAINGFALGGGLELAMACHLRIASENAKFGQPEVNLGLIPGYGGTQRLVRYIGKTLALELLLTADMIPAQQALQYGLVSKVVAIEDLIPTAKTILHKINSKAPIAISKTIAIVNDYFDPTKDGFQSEIEGFGACAATEDFKEGALAFIEKRPAVFKGK
jgi:enoyl-CoA hydratase